MPGLSSYVVLFSDFKSASPNYSRAIVGLVGLPYTPVYLFNVQDLWQYYNILEMHTKVTGQRIDGHSIIIGISATGCRAATNLTTLHLKVV